MFSEEDYKTVVNIPYALLVASCLTIIITISSSDENGLKGLIGGYSGLGLGILFLIMLNTPPVNWLDIFPYIVLLGVVGLTLVYLYTYFERIVKGEVSGYYYYFSFLSSIFIATQLGILVSNTINKSSVSGERLLSNRTFSILTLLGVVNYLFVITMGIVLRFYSTQG